MKNRLLTLAAAAVSVSLLAGCGDGDGSSSGSPGAGAVLVVKRYLDAMADGDYDKACSFFTDEYRASTIEEWNESMANEGDELDSCAAVGEAGTGFLVALTGGKPGDIWKYEKVEVEVDGSDARATFVLPALDQEADGYALRKVDGTWLISGEIDAEGGTGTADDSSREDAADSGSTVLEGAIGDDLELGDWTLRIDTVSKDADAELAETWEANEAPKGRYVLVTFEATYRGSERMGDIGSVIWKLTDSTQQVHDTTWTVTTPGEVAGWATQVRAGGTLRRQVAFDVDPVLLDDAILSVETVDGAFDSHVADIVI